VESNIGFAVLNLMSAKPGMRWDIEETRKTIGYMPQDGHLAEITETMRERETVSGTCPTRADGARGQSRGPRLPSDLRDARNQFFWVRL
jgi:hypothetical protein